MFFKKIFAKLESFTVTQLVYMPLFAGFLLIIAWILVRGSLKGTSIELVVFNFILVVFGCSGIPIIFYKETPDPWSTKGVMAIMNGLLILVGAWLIPILSLLGLITNMFR
jgi:hypothetical protein